MIQRIKDAWAVLTGKKIAVSDCRYGGIVMHEVEPRRTASADIFNEGFAADPREWPKVTFNDRIYGPSDPPRGPLV